MSLVGFKAQNHFQQLDKGRGNPSRDELGTDPALFEELDDRFRFTLDVAASHENAKCRRYLRKEGDGKIQPWAAERVWCNPPYSDLYAWLEAAWDHWNAENPPELIVMLLPANRTEQAWWQDHVEAFRDRPWSPLRVEFLRGRRRFVAPGALGIGPNERPPFGSVLLIWEKP